MSTGISQIKKAIIDGFFILLPLVLIVLILDETIQVLEGIVQPLVQFFPGQKVLGIEVATLLAWVLIFFMFMLVGLVSRTSLGRKIGTWFDDNVMNYLPGYQLLKTISRQFSGTGEETLLTPALFKTDMGTWMYAFILDEFENNMCSLFVPMAPTPMMGTVQYVEKSRVKKLDIPPAKVIDNLMQWGIDSKSDLKLQDYMDNPK